MGRREAGHARHDGVRIGLVLSAGGLRGAAHAGVLRALLTHGIPIDVIVGVSAGAVVAAYYAAVGLGVDELIADARTFRGRHLLAYSLALRCGGRLHRALGRHCGVIPDRLAQLESAEFDGLHHGVRGLGIVCHDVTLRRPCYFATGAANGAKLHEAVRASASMPYVFPVHPLDCHGGRRLLTDGGISDPVPLAFARRPPLSATHVIVSDCRWIGTEPAAVPDAVWIRPRLTRTGTLWGPRHGLLTAVLEGEAAVTEPVLSRIRAWIEQARDQASEAATSAGSPLQCPVPITSTYA